MKDPKNVIGTSANTTFDGGDEMVNEETQELFDNLVHLLAEYEYKTGRGLVMNLGIYSRDRKRGTSATYVHLVDAGHCDHCEELHAFPNMIPGSDLDQLLSSQTPPEIAERMSNATPEQMYKDPFGKEYLVYHGVQVRKVDENNWEQVPPRDEHGKEYPELLDKANYGEGMETNKDVKFDGEEAKEGFDVSMYEGRFISGGTKTLN
jgi:hypothetical protein